MTLTVGQLTRMIKEDLESNFSDLSVEGEITGFKKYGGSGHWYFSLKDSDALICCTMWKGYNSYVFFNPEDGMKVIASGKLSVYPPRGSYQLDVRHMKPAGVGDLQAAFERMKQKLKAEGLFEQELKKPMPEFPQKIGIVTSVEGAALRDMISVARRRFPLLQIVIAPAKVQGEGAAQSIAEGLELLNKRSDIDVIITGRGGGSLEDLWAFNEEAVARAIHNSRIPVVSAVGHETDFTISDFAADLRAATPTAAMELLSPVQEDFFSYLENFIVKSTNNISYIMGQKKEGVRNILNSYGFRVPQDLIRMRSQQVDNLFYRIEQKLDKKMAHSGNKLSLVTQKLEGGNIQRILRKGFVLVRQDSKFVLRGENFRQCEPAVLKFYDKEVGINTKNEQEKE